MYKYKNVKTGRIIEVKSMLAGGDWVDMEAAEDEPEETAEPAGEEELEEVAPVQQDKTEKKNPEKPAGGAVIKPRKGK